MTSDALPDLLSRKHQQQALDFIRAVVQWTFEAYDGADDIQELAIKHGVLRPTMMSEPCNSHLDDEDCDDYPCACAEMGAEFPTTCYRLADQFCIEV